MLVVVLYNPNETGKNYRIATEKDIEIYNNAEKYLDKKIKSWEWLESPLPQERIPTPDGKKINDKHGMFFVYLQPVLYNMPRFDLLFNARQKLALVTLLDQIKSNYQKIEKDCEIIASKNDNINPDNLAKAVMGYLGLIFSRCTDFETTLCPWHPQWEFSTHTFSRQAISMSWNYSELNLFSPVLSGTWKSMLRQVLRPLRLLGKIENSISKASMDSCTSLHYPDDFFDAVFTDPPYYDNIPYGNISDFFYVWLKRCVGELLPNLFATPLTPKTQECIQNSSLVRRGKDLEKSDFQELGIKDKEFFEKQMTKSLKEIYRVLKPNGIATIVYAYKTTKGWETMLNSLINSGFVVTASWPIHTEMKDRLRAIASATLASSIYMVCRKIERQPIGFWKEIQQKIKNNIDHKMQQFWNQGIVGGDFFISAIGPGMEIFSRFKRVETYSGKVVDTKELLKYIRSIVTEFIINRLLKNASPANIDKESQFYLAYRWTYLDNRVVFDDARKLASAMGINLENLWNRGFVKKTRKYISVKGPKDRKEIKRIDNMVDVMHNSALLWEKGKTGELKDFLSDTGYNNSEAFWQFCQAVAESLLPGDKEKQLLEGFLIGRERYSDIKLSDSSQKRMDEFSEG